MKHTNGKRSHNSCNYSHDPSTRVPICKYFTAGKCFKGACCGYAHHANALYYFGWRCWQPSCAFEHVKGGGDFHMDMTSGV